MGLHVVDAGTLFRADQLPLTSTGGQSGARPHRFCPEQIHVRCNVVLTDVQVLTVFETTDHVRAGGRGRFQSNAKERRTLRTSSIAKRRGRGSQQENERNENELRR